MTDIARDAVDRQAIDLIKAGAFPKAIVDRYMHHPTPEFGVRLSIWDVVVKHLIDGIDTRRIDQTYGMRDGAARRMILNVFDHWRGWRADQSRQAAQSYYRATLLAFNDIYRALETINSRIGAETDPEIRRQTERALTLAAHGLRMAQAPPAVGE